LGLGVEKVSDENIIDSMKRFGLTEEEARVYIRLPSISSLTDEGISEELKMPIEDVRRIMKNLEEKGFVRSYMLGIYQPTTPVEALNRRIETILSELYKLKGDMVGVLEEKFLPPALISCSVDRSHFNILVDRLTEEARKSVSISTKELKFIEESDFINTLEKNPRLRVGSVEILLTTNEKTPDLGDVISRLRVLSKSSKVRIKHNPSRTELRYMIMDKKRVLLVEADHKRASIIESEEVAQYFDYNFAIYFEKGRDIAEMLDAVKDIKRPEQKDEEVRKILTTKGYL
jgi:predicted transcriptional regulator